MSNAYDTAGAVEELRRNIIMCLAILGKLTEKTEEAGMLMGTVDYGGRTSKVYLACVPDLHLGQYTIVHAGFAIAVLDEDQIRQPMETRRKMTDM